MRAIMYHYVRPFNPEYPNLKYLHIEDFRNQLDYFEKEFGFLTKEDFQNSLNEGKSKEGVILTFDDGLSCHYNYVFKELKKRGLWGIFYIATQPLTEGGFLDVHRIHLLLGKYNSREIYDFLFEIIDRSMFDKSKLDEFNELTYSSQLNDHYTLLVKRILNYFISYKYRSEVIDMLMGRFIPEEEMLLRNFYLTRAQILEMHKSGMIIGSHTINHPVMSRLSYVEQQYQIHESFKYLKGIIEDFNLKTFCYPYGGFHSFNEITEGILNEIECQVSFNVEQRIISNIDLTMRPQALPRFDCNQFRYGQVRNESYSSS